MSDALQKLCAELVEKRLAARFLGRTLDQETLGEIAAYLDDLKSRLFLDEPRGVLVERDADDPTKIMLYFADPPLDTVRFPDWPSARLPGAETVSGNPFQLPRR